MAPPNLAAAAAVSVLDGEVHDGSILLKPCSITLQDGEFLARGHPFLVDVPSNVVVTPASAVVSPSTGATKVDAAVAVDAEALSRGCFVGFAVPDGEAKSWVAAPLGRLVGVPFMSIFRFKVWWTTHWVGRRGRDLEHETQFLLLDKSAAPEEEDEGEDGGRPYVLVLPIVEGPFRACLRPGSTADNDDNVEVVVESGSTKVRGSRFRGCVYMHAGRTSSAGTTDPFGLVKEAMRVVRAHLGTFKLLEEKTPPPIVDKMGWCTWDAFYLKVHPSGVWQGVQTLVDGGCPPGLVLIDDGWQSICHDEDDPDSGTEGMNRTSAGEQMPCRLIKFEENYKFRDYRSKSGTKSGGGGEGERGGMGAFTSDLKSAFPSVEHVYVWHALAGYWGGLRPGVAGMPEARVVRPKLTPGLETTMEDLAVDKIVNNGVGLVPPEKAAEMYEGLHSHLAASGIDGVKVDVIHLLEMLSEDYGGRVDLAKAYFSALSDSVRRHFNGNGVIASMEHCNDFMLLGTDAISLGRVGDDFWCTDPSGDPNGAFWLQGCHMVHCAYNSLWMGNFIHPDWDMFQSVHPCAEFHAASRAVSGGPVYVSDCVGEHDFGLLKELGLPDGTILRCEGYALPTRDCLFVDPLHDGKTMLKIWNLNKFTGVLGAFNCQGGGWCRESRRNKSASKYSHRITTVARPNDIEWQTKKPSSPLTTIDNKTSFAVYSYRQGKLQLLAGLHDGIEIALDPFHFELLTVSPITTVRGVQFAPIGLVNMLNTGGAIQDIQVGDRHVDVAVRGAGVFKAFSSEKPLSCRVDGQEVEFEYDEPSHVVAVQVVWPGSSNTLTTVRYSY